MAIVAGGGEPHKYLFSSIESFDYFSEWKYKYVLYIFVYFKWLFVLKNCFQYYTG